MYRIADFPLIERELFIPEKLILWKEKSNKYKDKTCHFFTNDSRFSAIANNRCKYLQQIRKYEAVITPDFSLYLDYPEPLKIYNTFKTRELGVYWQEKGIKVIPSVNWADARSFSYCLEGIERKGVIAITSNTIRKRNLSFNYFMSGVEKLINYLEPHLILVKGLKFFEELKKIDSKLFKFYP